MERSAGFSAIEVLGTLGIAAILLALVLGASHSWIRRQAGRSAVYEVQAHLEMARAEAITRNRDCSFRIDSDSGRIDVVDLVDPSDTSDDVVLRTVTLAPTIAFDRPDPGAAIGLDPISADSYQAVFTARGSVSVGDGEIVLECDGDYHRITLYAAGGVGVERWDGAAWSAGA